MFAALTGTPGTGKSTVGRALATSGFRIIDLRTFARDLGLARRTADGDVLDIEAIGRRLPPSTEGPVVIEGLLSHLLPVDRAIVLRCNPEVLRRRLADRGWPRGKVEENVEAEAVDVILLESLERCDDVREVDTTAVTPAEVEATVAGIVEGRDPGHKPGSVDWSDVILSWY